MTLATAGARVGAEAGAEARQGTGSRDGLDVVAPIGALRHGQHRTRAEIWRHLTDGTPVRISKRHVQNLVEVYLALLRASRGTCRRVGRRSPLSAAG